MAAEAAPEELTAIANVMVAPPMPDLPEEAHGQPVILAFICYAGEGEAGEDAVAPFRALARPIADHLGPMPYPEIYRLTEEGPLPPRRWRARSSSTASTSTRPRRSSTSSGIDRAMSCCAAPRARRRGQPGAR